MAFLCGVGGALLGHLQGTTELCTVGDEYVARELETMPDGCVDLAHDKAQPWGCLSYVAQTTSEFLDLRDRERSAFGVPSGSHEGDCVLHIVFWCADSHGSCIDDYAQNLIAKAYDHVKQFVPADWVLTCFWARVAKDREDGFNRGGYGLFNSSNRVYFRENNVVHKRVLRCVLERPVGIFDSNVDGISNSWSEGPFCCSECRVPLEFVEILPVLVA